MNRRGFLRSILATASAPAIVRAASLMPVAWVQTEAGLVTPALPAGIIASSEAVFDGFSGNRILTINEITKEALRIAYDKLSFIGGFDRLYEETFFSPQNTCETPNCVDSAVLFRHNNHT